MRSTRSHPSLSTRDSSDPPPSQRGLTWVPNPPTSLPSISVSALPSDIVASLTTQPPNIGFKRRTSIHIAAEKGLDKRARRKAHRKGAESDTHGARRSRKSV